MHDPQSVQTLDTPPEEGVEISERPPEMTSDSEDQEEPRPREPWHVEDAEVLACIPKNGLIHDYMEYCPTTCDGALWFQLGGWLTVLGVVAGKCDYHVEAANGRYEVGGLHLWSANVGYTGTRKSQCVKPAMRILRAIDGEAVLATDGSIEAIHDVLAGDNRQGIGIFHRDEMNTLLTQAKRSYSTGLFGWMLEGYEGGPQIRTTKAGGTVMIPRVRVSVLGNIPPSTLQQNTSRENWREGFLPRFLFWGARRTRYMAIAPGDPRIESIFADFLKRFLYGRSLQIIIPHTVGKVITDWHRREVDLKGAGMPDELYSTLLRLRSKGFQLAAIYAAARLDRPIKDGKGIFVEQQDVEYALEVIKLHRRSTVELFGYVGGSDEATQENRVLMHIATSHHATTSTIATSLGISVKAAMTTCQTLVSQGLVETVAERSGGRGRPKILYVIPQGDR